MNRAREAGWKNLLKSDEDKDVSPIILVILK